VPKSEPIPPFEFCKQCKQLAEASQSEPVCPAQNNGELTEDKLRELMSETPFERWHPPKQIAAYYSYSTKQIIRITDEHKSSVASVRINKRMFINFCSIYEYMEEVNKPKPKE
jgi:hypothetical protein